MCASHPERFEQERRVGAHPATPLDDRVETLEQNQPARRFDLRHAERLEKRLQRYFAWMGRRSISWQHAIPQSQSVQRTTCAS
jgi:hypothetical protein